MCKTNFLGEEVLKYHKTFTTYVNTLIKLGFEITKLREPEPDLELFKDILEMKEELRRPMFLIISARKEIELHCFTV